MSTQLDRLKQTAHKLLVEIDLSTDCMSNQIKRERIDHQLEVLEHVLGEGIGKAAEPMAFSVQELRPEVMAFALLMEQELRKKDADKGPGWKKKTDIDLTVNVCTAARSIEQALFPHRGERSIKALVDMSNHCMMLADVLGALRAEDGGAGWSGLDQVSPQ